METLEKISVIWSMSHFIIVFLLLFESRYTKKKTLTVVFATLLPLILINYPLFVVFGVYRYSMLVLLTFLLPSGMVFYLLAKYRDGRFFFTLCIVATAVLEIVYGTNILNYYITPDTYLVMFFVRLMVYPLIEYWEYKKLRAMFLNVQKRIIKGWGFFAVIGVLFLGTIILLMNYPTTIFERSENIPVLALLFLLMPLIYTHIIGTLRRQQKLHEMTEQENILQLQVSNLTARMEEYSAADDKFRVERHNFRHKLKTFASLMKAEQYDECMILLAEYGEALDRTKLKRYCQHTILDAVLSSYIQKAQANEIDVEMGFSFPDIIPMNESELATALANALENAINACEKLEPKKRFIDIKVLNYPRFMIRIVNSYEGEIEFDEDNIPVNTATDHGFGTRFIAAFCQKNGGYYQFEADGEKFTLYLNF